MTAYDGALEPGGADFRSFFTWFRKREDLENEQRRDDPAHTDVALAAVRRAIEAFTGFHDLRVRRRPLRMTLKKESGEELTVQQLSDGEQCFLALIGDLARRLAVLNPHLENPLEGGGVVMIDEIELHLHPKWQRIILPRLEEIFPNCQFLVTTHSPQVLSHVRAEDVWVLYPDENGEITAEQPEMTYGVDSSLLLQQVLGVAERNPEVQRELDALFRAIEDEDPESARAELDRMRADYGDLPPLARAEAVLNRRARAQA